jgi:predicted metal-dependent phosphoesterase TrpH
MIDLHTHSTFSDGSETPGTLARMAKEVGLAAIALTDHDTTASHDEMQDACDAEGIELIPGTEISVVDHEFPRVDRDGNTTGRGVHVLAYFLPLDPSSPMQQVLTRLRADRLTRNQALVTLLQDLGFERLTFSVVEGLARSADSIGRPHFAEAMFSLHPEIVGERTPESWSNVFVEWLGSGGKAYLPKTELTLEEVVAAAAGSSTVFSMAHPLLNYLGDYTGDRIEREMPAIIRSLKDRGFTGIEAHYGGTSRPIRDLMVKLTRDAGMIPTGGSDFHGTFKKDVALGRGYSGDLAVPDHVLEELRAASARSAA